MENKKPRKVWISLGNGASNVTLIEATKDKPIRRLLKNGEMAPVEWFEHDNCEYSGKFIIKIEYF